MDKKTEKELLYFDEKEYKRAIDDLKAMVPSVKYIAECWQMQPILQDEPFTNKHYAEILRSGSDYIQRIIEGKVTAALEKQLKGLSGHVAPQKVQLKNVDEEKLGRIVNSLKSYVPGTRSARINCKMIEIDKAGKPYITKETEEKLKEGCALYNDNPKVTKFVELGKIAAGTLTAIQKILDEKHKKKELARGWKLPDKKIFHQRKEGVMTLPGERYGLLYEEEGEWFLNYDEFKSYY